MSGDPDENCCKQLWHYHIAALQRTTLCSRRARFYYRLDIAQARRQQQQQLYAVVLFYSNSFERCLQGPYHLLHRKFLGKRSSSEVLETIYGQRTIHFHSDIYELELHYQHVIIMIIILHIEHVENNRFERKKEQMSRVCMKFRIEM